MKNLAFLSLFIMCLISCKSSKTAVTPEQFQATNSLVAEKQFEFIADWAFPLNTNSLNQIANSGLLGIGNSSGRVNLIGNPNFIRFKNDSISGYLPFFGERQISSFNSTDTGISFSGIPVDYEEVVNQENNSIKIRFNIAERTEAYQVFMTIFGNRSARISINSSQRNAIRYDGTIKEMDQE
ncbi:DUF4251 domain-containing protein [Dokdonia sinensis]|uniref:DUF4251 domain-containing protein n=1 Tax=Dokdonia sinensis TaxID=2479847 RepID=A0A3M0G3R2_9FLAO|nr:DUF4251 domain-containing protein [Dokdonia sinensis]RMB59465.1 DUF4251 domain-containing protein [Dokdonia sinensis]